jgi:hypothetical protein
MDTLFTVKTDGLGNAILVVDDEIICKVKIRNESDRAHQDAFVEIAVRYTAWATAMSQR